jgi:hypothetical protein
MTAQEFFARVWERLISHVDGPLFFVSLRSLRRDQRFGALLRLVV